MSTTYKTRLGDTFSSIAAGNTGLDTNAAEIKRANPGVLEPIRPGTTIRIPGMMQKFNKFRSQGIDIIIDNIRYDCIEEIKIKTAFDATRKGSLRLPNEPKIREKLIPMFPHEVKIGYNGKPLLTGRTGAIQPVTTEARKELSVEIYSECAVLEDASPPITAFPLEFLDMDLEKIAHHLCDIMSVGCIFNDRPGSKFKQTNIEPEEAILTYISDLAAQRNLFVSDDEDGNLILQMASLAVEPALTIQEDYSPGATIESTFDNSQYYSSITGLVKAKTRKQGAIFTKQNPFVTGITRPYTRTFEDIDPGELETAVDSMAGRMFAQFFRLNITFPSWENDKGELIKDNQLISVYSPTNYINQFSNFLISNVEYFHSNEQKYVTMEAVLPNALRGEMPEGLPW